MHKKTKQNKIKVSRFKINFEFQKSSFLNFDKSNFSNH